MQASNLPVPTTVFFIEQVAEPMNFLVPLVPVIHLYGCWNNTILYTSFESAIFGVNCPTNSKKIFYLTSADWVNCKSYDFNKQLELINRSDYFICENEELAQLITNHYGITPTVLPSFNLETICKL